MAGDRKAARRSLAPPPKTPRDKYALKYPPCVPYGRWSDDLPWCDDDNCDRCAHWNWPLADVPPDIAARIDAYLDRRPATITERWESTWQDERDPDGKFTWRGPRRHLLSYLARFVKADATLFMSQEKAAHEIGQDNPRHVREYFGDFRQAGLIETVARGHGRAGARGVASTYRVIVNVPVETL